MREKKARNKKIGKEYILGQGGKMGKRYGGLSRQRIHQIKNKKQDGFLTRLFDKILYLFLAY